jgi:hypothetical protein
MTRQAVLMEIKVELLAIRVSRSLASTNSIAQQALQLLRDQSIIP